MNSQQDVSTDSQSVGDVTVIATNLSRNYTGVSATIRALLPIQKDMCSLYLYGEPLPDCPEPIDKLALLSILAREKAAGRRVVWHARRNSEMLLGFWLKNVRRFPISLVFTSASQRRHSAVPRWLISQMDAVIATTERAGTFLSRDTTVISHGVDIDRFSPGRGREAEWRDRDLPGTYGIGVFGRIRPAKGTDLFVDALCRLLPRYPQHTAVIVGSCKSKHEDWRLELADRVEQAGLSDRMIWTGELPIDEVPLWYRSMSVCITPARHEEFGLTPLEASASGAAAVATRTGAFAEIIVDGQTGRLVATDNLQSLVEGLEPLMRDPALAAKMGEAGRARAVDHYDIRKEAAAIVAVYRNLAGSNQR